jgi:hypothetical protein
MTEVNTVKLIAVEGDPEDDGTKITATPDGITVSGSVNGEYGISEVSAPWPAVLEHAPTAELVAALKGREGVEAEELSDNWHEFNITTPTTAIFVERRP